VVFIFLSVFIISNANVSSYTYYTNYII